jgi:hypothetical protein
MMTSISIELDRMGLKSFALVLSLAQNIKSASDSSRRATKM